MKNSIGAMFLLFVLLTDLVISGCAAAPTPEPTSTPVSTRHAELPEDVKPLYLTPTETLMPKPTTTPENIISPQELQILTKNLQENMKLDVSAMSLNSNSIDRTPPLDGDIVHNEILLSHLESIFKIAESENAVENLSSITGVQPFSLRVFLEGEKDMLAQILPNHISLEAVRALESSGWKIIFVGHNYIEERKLTFANLFGVDEVVTGSYNTGRSELPAHLATGLNDSVLTNVAIGVSHEEFLSVNDQMEDFGFSPVLHFVVKVPDGANGINLPTNADHTLGIVVIPPGASLEQFISTILNFHYNSGAKLEETELWKILEILTAGTSLVTTDN